MHFVLHSLLHSLPSHVCMLVCSVLKVSPDAMDSNSSTRQRVHPSPSPVRGTRNSTPTMDGDDV